MAFQEYFTKKFKSLENAILPRLDKNKAYEGNPLLRAKSEDRLESSDGHV